MNMSAIGLTTSVEALRPAPRTAARRPRLSIIAGALPPRLDGIGDHSSGLASTLAGQCEITIYTVSGFVPAEIPDVEVVQNFQAHPRRSVTRLAAAVEAEPPDWLIVQYNPFSFGRRGFNPYLPRVLKRIKRTCPQTRLALMAHEHYMPPISIRYALMFLYQRWQFEAIASLADVTLFSTGPWHDAYRRRHPDRRSCHMPVGSNVPLVAADRQEVRRELDIAAGSIVLGAFGGSHPSRLLGHVAASARALKSAGIDVDVLSIGPAGPDLRALICQAPVIDLGELPAPRVSRYLRAMDIFCSPYMDGISTRRGSFFAALQHGLPIVTTVGYHTDGELRALDGKALLAVAPQDPALFAEAALRLARDPALRQRLGRSAREYSEAHFSLPVLGRRWLDVLEIQCQ